MTTLKLSQIMADVDQPRKRFDAQKLASLKSSIKKYGIMNPIRVEKISENKYLIEDGERRYRVAKELKLEEVQVIILKPTSKVERLIQQFHVQEQHEAWSPTEKASVVGKLSKEMGMAYAEVCEALAIPKRTADRYIAFSNLMEKNQFERSEIPLDYAIAIHQVRNQVKKIYHNVLEEDFSSTDEKTLERNIIHQVLEGGITKRQDLVKLKDAFAKDPKAIKTFLDTNVTPEALFLKTKAKGSRALRLVYQLSSYISAHIEVFLANPDMKPTEQQITRVKRARASIDRFLKAVE